MMYLRQSTASQAVLLGPFVDSTDGVTAETGLTIAASDIRLSKNGANIVGKNSGGGTHDEIGYYTITLDATDTNTLGRLQVMVSAAGALAVYDSFMVLPQQVYDSLVLGSDNLNVEAATIAGGAVTSIQSGLATASALATVDGVVDSILVDTGTTLPATLSDIQGTTFATSTDSLEAIRNRGDAAWTTGAGGSAPTAADIRAEIDSNSTQLAAIVADTNELQSDWANDGRLDLILDSRSSQASVNTIDGIVDAILLDTAEIGAAGAGLSAIPWNASWDAEVQSEVTDGLIAYDPPTRAELASDIAGLNDPSLADINATVDTALADYDGPTRAELTSDIGSVTSAISGLNDISPAQVNAEVIDAFSTDTYAEPGSGAPPATASLAVKIGYLYKNWRNRKTQSATDWVLYGDNATTAHQSAAVSDDGTDAEKEEIGGP